MDLEDLEDAYPPTAIQQGMLFHCLESDQSDVFVCYITIDINGALDAERYRIAWDQVTLRHALLRGSFLWEGLDEPLLLINKSVTIPWTEHDWSTTPQTDKLLTELLASERRKPLPPDKPPLQRLNLVKLSDNHHKLVWTVQHLLIDGWSTQLVLSDVLESYSAQFGNEVFSSTPFPFSSHAAWITSQDKQSASEFWQSRLGTINATPLKLPVCNNTTAFSQHKNQNDINADTAKRNSGVAAMCRRQFTADQTERINNYSRNSRVTLSTVFYGAWALLLQLYTGNSQVLFGVTSTGRQNGLPGVDTAVGPYLNTLPLAIDIQPETPLPVWLSQLQRHFHPSLAYDFCSLLEATSHLPTDSKVSLETIVVTESHDHDIRLDSPCNTISVENLNYMAHSNFPLALIVYPGLSLKLFIVYDDRKYTEAQVETILDHLFRLIDTMILATDAPPVSSIADKLLHSVLLENQHHYVANAPPDYRKITHRTITSWIGENCSKYAERPALIFGNQQLSYKDLQNRTNQMANLVLQHCKSGPSCVGLHCKRGIDQIAAMLGINTAGFAYVPLDPEYPAERIAQIVEDSGIELVLGDVIPTADNTHCVSLQQADNFPAIPPFGSNPPPSAPAYIIYTSGSTGRAKGVAISHENLVYSTRARIDYYKDLQDSSFILLSSISFDSSVAGIFGTLCAGGTLVLPAQDEEKDVEAIADIISRHRVTHTLCLPSLYSLLLTFGKANQLESLQTVVVAGEVCRDPVTKLHFGTLPDTRLFNEYGPTEATVWSTVFPITTTPQQIPIGSPIPGAVVYVIDNTGKPCLPGVEGELAIAGSGVAAGYYNDPLLTAQRFVNTHEIANASFSTEANAATYTTSYRTGDSGYLGDDGYFHFTGRIDRQLKIRGHRIEPGEIEVALLHHPAVTDVIVQLSESLTTHEHASADSLIESLTTELTGLDASVALDMLQRVKNTRLELVDLSLAG